MALTECPDKPRLTRPVTDLESQATKFFHDLILAKTEWDEACQNLQHAHERRNSAETILRQLTDQAQKVLQLNLLDPTEPQAMQAGNTAPNPGNGVLGKALNRSY